MVPAQKGVVGAAVTSANNVTNPTTLTPALPAHAVGDLLLCYTACRSATPTVACAGWTQLANVTGTNGRMALFGKIATSASETAPSVVWSGLTTGTSGTPVQAQCSVFTGTQLNVGALGTIENGAASATVSASGTGITTVADNALVLALSARLDDAGTWTPPSGFTEIGEAASTSGADMSFSWAYQVKATAGAVAPADFAIASGVSFASTGLLVALRSIVPVTYFGVVSLPITYGQTINGSRETFSTLDLPVTFGAIVSGEASTPSVTYYGSVTADWQFGAASSGQRTTFGQTALAINASIVTAGIRVAKTLYGAVALPIAFGAVVSGSRKTLGQLSLPITFLKDIQGQRKTFGQLLSPWIFSKDVRAQRKTFGQVAMPLSVTIATSGLRPGVTFYGALSLPVTFTKDVRGQRKTFGQIALPIGFVKDVKGVRKTFGQIVFPIIFTKEAVGRKNVFGALSMQTLFGKEVAGRRKTFSQIAVPLIFTKDVRGQRKTFGQITFPVGITIAVSGKAIANRFGSLSMPIIFGKEVIARRKTFGQITAPFIYGSVSQGYRRTFGQVSVPLVFSKEVVGRIGAHGQIAFPIVVGFVTAGNKKIAGVILNQAEMVYLGIEPVEAVYAGIERVWPGFGPLDVAGITAWLDASQLDLANGVGVYSWPDSSGHGSGVMCRVGEDDPPKFVVGAHNGLSAIRFVGDPGAQFLFNTVTPIGPVGDIFVVAKYDLPLFHDYDGLFGDTGVLLLLGEAGSNRLYPAPNVAAYWRNGSESTGTRLGPMEELTVLGLTLVSPYAAVHPTVGTDRFNWPRFWKGDVCEIITYDHALIAEERQKVDAYLQKKWGI